MQNRCISEPLKVGLICLGCTFRDTYTYISEAIRERGRCLRYGSHRALWVHTTCIMHQVFRDESEWLWYTARPRTSAGPQRCRVPVTSSHLEYHLLMYTTSLEPSGSIAARRKYCMERHGTAWHGWNRVSAPCYEVCYLLGHTTLGNGSL